MATGTQRAVYAALIGNLLVAVTKFGAAWWTGSSSMLTEGVHSLVDTGNEVLLLYGMARSIRQPDPVHPLGYGRELYFWSFIVALSIFAVGAGVSVYEGVIHMRDPEPITDPVVNYIVLGLSLLFEAGSWSVAYREFAKSRGELGWWEAVRRSKDPPSFMVLFEDSAALVGLVIAFAGTAASVALDAPWIDGGASVAIGVVLGLVALVLARKSKGLLIGERASPAVIETALGIASAHPAVRAANGALTIQLAPDQVAVALSIDFDEQLRTPEISASVERIEAEVRAALPQVRVLFVKPQTPGAYAEARDRLFGKTGPSPSS